MTRDEFIKQAIAAGKSREEIEPVFNRIEAAGEFDDGPAFETEAPKEPNVFGKIASDIGKRTSNMMENANEYQGGVAGALFSPTPSAMSYRLRQMGEGLGVVTDIANRGREFIGGLIPQSAKDVASQVYSPGDWVRDPNTGKMVKREPGALQASVDQGLSSAISKAGELYGSFKEKNPGAAKNVEAVGNTALGAAELAGLVGTGQLIKGGFKMLTPSPEDALKKSIRKGMEQGVKPTVIGKYDVKRYSGFFDKADDAVRTIAANRANINLVDDAGRAVAYPRNAQEFAQAIDQTKKQLYKQYHQMALDAGDAGAQFDASNILKELDRVSKSKKFDPQVRAYADDMKSAIGELTGEAPEVIESRIADLNNSLAGYYDGRVGKAKAQVDASVAALMREELDNKIAGATGEGYQALKNQYGALKHIEKEVNKRALVNARKAPANVFDLTDVFTGGELITGVLTANPALIAKGASGRGIKEILKVMNDPDRKIAKMFKDAYGIVDELPTATIPSGPFDVPSAGPNLESPAFARAGIVPERALRREAQEQATRVASNQAEREAGIAAKGKYYEDLSSSIRDLRPQAGGANDELYSSIRDYQSGRTKYSNTPAIIKKDIYESVEEALLDGHKPGDRIKLRGVGIVELE